MKLCCRLFLVLTALAAVSLAVAQPAVAIESSPGLALIHANLIDGTGAPIRTDTTVVTRQGKIVAVGPAATTEVPSGMPTLDLRGRFVIPGLIDSHVHLTSDQSLTDVEANLRWMLAHGVTSVRDMAGDTRLLAFLQRLELVGRLQGPEIVFAALFSGPTFFSDRRAIAASIGFAPGQAPWMQAVTPDSDLARAIAAAKGTGAQAIKIYANLDAAMVSAITAEAHRQGLRVWAHAAVFPARPSEVAAAGVDTVSHSPYLVWETVAKMPDSYTARKHGDYSAAGPDDPRILRLLDTLRDRGIVLDATLTAFVEEAKEPPAKGAEPPSPGLLPWSYAVTREAHDRGVEVSGGTDDMGSPDRAPTPNLLREIGLLVERCGFTPLEALHSATAVSAKAAGLAASKGTVEVGKDADLVILAGDPTADLKNLSQIVYVVQAGRLVTPPPD